MNDIRPVKKPSAPRTAPPVVVPVTPDEHEPKLVAVPDATALNIKRPRSRLRWVFITIIVLAILALGAAVGAYIWYKQELRPVSSNSSAAKTRLTIEAGTTPDEIAVQLKTARLIRSKTAFALYTRLHHVRDKLQAGTYSLSPLSSTPDIVDDLTSGHVDEFSITFLPGATLSENKEVLKKAGYSMKEIDAALAKTYDHPLFAAKPQSADLEGYIFGDTYNFAAGASVEEILTRTFDEYYAFIEKYDLIAKLKEQKLNLYQGITLASIVQREVSPKVANEPSHDQRQVAQVFLKRLHDGTVLGSDVTYKYAAKEFGLPDDPSQNSAYNTRKVKGLPPGPIAVPGGGALRAVADPAKGDYEYFLAGDDGIVYFSHTNAEHEKNIQNHCKINCAE